jgi:IS5 family transposase
MLRKYFVQHWFNLADVACEDALLDSMVLRRFVGIDLGRELVPDATTLLKFRRPLEKHKLGEALFAKVGEVLQANGMKLHIGVDSETGLAHPSGRPMTLRATLRATTELTATSRPSASRKSRESITPPILEALLAVQRVTIRRFMGPRSAHHGIRFPRLRPPRAGTHG